MHTMKKTRISNIVLTCIILHNMRIEEYISGDGKYKPDDGIAVEPMNDSFAALDDAGYEQDGIENVTEPNEWMLNYAENEPT